MKIPHGKVCQFTRITTTGMNVSLTEHYIPVNYFIIYYIIIYLLHHIQTGKTTPIRRTDVREAGVSRTVDVSFFSLAPNFIYGYMSYIYI